MASTGLAAAAGVDEEGGGGMDDFDDLFGAGFEDLSDGEDGGTGEEAERELHAKVRVCTFYFVVYLLFCSVHDEVSHPVLVLCASCTYFADICRTLERDNTPT